MFIWDELSLVSLLAEVSHDEALPRRERPLLAGKSLVSRAGAPALPLALFSCSSNLRDDGINSWRQGLRMGMDFRGQVLKRVWKMTFFGVK